MAIQTVLGLIEKQELGFCHAHEHIFLAEGPYTKVNPALRIDDFHKSCKELMSFKDIGGKTVVDAQPIGCGRMADALVAAAKQTGVHIVACTGFHKFSNYNTNHWLFSMDTSSLTELFCQEIRHGMFIGTDAEPPVVSIDARAGAIKTAIDEDRMEDSDKKWFDAAAEASIVTGVPIICHTESAKQGLYLAEFYLKRGVVSGNIIICHLDRTLVDVNLHREIASLGVFVEYDTIGRFKYHDDEGEVRLIARMLEWGFEHSILVGLDTTRERLESYGGSIGLRYIAQKFIPLMRSFGIPETPIRRMVVENPADAFSVKL